MDKEEKIPYDVSAGIKDKQIGTIYIARDEGICYDEDEHKSQGKLHLFYGNPLERLIPSIESHRPIH